MIIAVLAFAVAMQQPLTRDSAAVARLFTSLRGADSAVCELAGRALTNFGGWWGANGDLPMPMPMPMPFADGGIHVNPSIHGVGWHKKADAVALGAFRVGLRDPSRCVRHIAARVLGDAKPPWAYQTFTAMSKDADAGLRETGILGLGELEDPRSLGGLGDALADRETRVRAMAAWALGELEDSRAIEPLKRVLATGTRLSDLRRLVRQYGRAATSVFPSGPYRKGGVYGTDPNFPVPTQEELQNPGAKCLDRNA